MQCLRDTQTEAQQAISRLVSAYPLWTSSACPVEKWPSLVAKFSSRYEVDISPPARQWRKKRGQCSAHLVGAALPPDAAGVETVRWVLLVTEKGKGEVKEQEKLRDARRDRIVWGDYVLMRMARPRQHGGGSRWTWCLTPQVERQEANYLTGLAQAAARGGDSSRLLAYTQILVRRPMHSGVRTQIAKMLRRARRVWDQHSESRPWPGPVPDDLPILTYRRRDGRLAQ